MSAEAALLEACRWSPDDDAPRLVWADTVGGERGELVVLQCDLARGGLSPAAAAARRRRERELLAAHGRAWSGLGEFECRCELRRGFVEAIELDARVFARHGDEIFERAPLLRSLTAVGLTVTSGDPLDGLRALLDAPAFWRLDGLDLVEVGLQTQAFDYDPGFDGHGDEAARLLAGSGAIAHLDALGISRSGLGAVGAHHLVASGALARLEKLWLRGHDLGTDAVLAVLARTPRVASLDLHGATELETIAPALPPVTELALSRITDDAIAALGRSRAAATLEVLRLSSGSLERLDILRVFPRLRVLDLHGAQLTDQDRGADDLAAALPALRRLRVAPYTPEPALRVLAAALGPQLEDLELMGGMYPPELLDELRAHIAGEVVDEWTAPALL